jgi:hypothetical protein
VGSKALDHGFPFCLQSGTSEILNENPQRYGFALKFGMMLYWKFSRAGSSKPLYPYHTNFELNTFFWCFIINIVTYMRNMLL